MMPAPLMPAGFVSLRPAAGLLAERINPLPLPLTFTFALRMMDRPASNVSECPVPILLMAALTVISSTACSVTFVPVPPPGVPLSALKMVDAVIVLVTLPYATIPPGRLASRPDTTVRLVGSSNQSPVVPNAAEVTTIASGTTLRMWPDVSTIPPLPDCDPPLAVTVPENCVLPLDQIETVPPLPFVRASA